jgi:uncharacterized OsmC-like protein
MNSMKVRYNGNLRCTATHLKSGNELITDAPTDNNGKGEAFSPTDLLCTALTTCMITLMGITANSKEIKLGEIDADIEKIMGSDPRRVSGINIHFKIQNLDFTDREKEIIKTAAMTCPVAKSIHPDIELGIEFQFV